METSSPLISRKDLDPIARKERLERNRQMLNELYMFPGGGQSDLSEGLNNMSISSNSSPLTSPKIVITSEKEEEKNDEPATTRSDTLTRCKTNSKEKLVFEPYGENGDHVLNINKQSFDQIDFCFCCGKEPLILLPLSPPIVRRRGSVSISSSSDSIENNTTWGNVKKERTRRHRSTSSIGAHGRDHLKSSIELTGGRFFGERGYLLVYRKVFQCTTCYESTLKEKTNNPDHVFKLSDRARTYF